MDIERDPVEALAEEFVARYRAGDEPSIEEYASRYPDYSDEIRGLFPTLCRMEELGSEASDANPPAVPTMGDSFGNYRIVRLLGQGGMGMVFEAVHQLLLRRVALKVLSNQPWVTETRRTRFRQEARLAAQLHHTHIVPVFDVGDQNGTLYYAMQFIEGRDLAEILRARQIMQASGDAALPRTESGTPWSMRETPPDGPEPQRSGVVRDGSSTSSTTTAGSPRMTVDWATLDSGEYLRRVVRLGADVADALSLVHQRGMVHRDIKPANLLLDESGKVWVTDFGLARDESVSPLTASGNLVGTLRYLAPERLGGPAEPASDQYSLGATLYELMTGQPAFTDRDRLQLLESIGTREPQPPRQLDSTIPREIEIILQKSMQKSSSDRYGSMAEFRDDLVRWLEHRPIHARPLGIPGRVVRSAQRHPTIATLTVAILIVTFLGLGLTGWQWQVAESERRRAEQNFQMAQAAVGEFSTVVAQGWGPLHANPATRQLRQQLLDRATFYFQQFVNENGPDANRGQLGYAHYCLADLALKAGKPEEAEPHFRSAIANWQTPRLSRLNGLPGNYWQGQAHLGMGNVALANLELSQAADWFDTARRYLAPMPAETAAASRMQLALARANTHLALCTWQLGDIPEAEHRFAIAADQHAAIPPDPNDRGFEFARQRGQSALWRARANLCWQTGKPQQAMQLYEAAWQAHLELSDWDEKFPWHRDEWCACAIDSAIAFRESGELAEAENRLRAGLQAIGMLCEQQPGTPRYLQLQARAKGNLANLMVDQGRHEEARSIYQQLVLSDSVNAISSQALEQDSESVRWLINLALLERDLGELKRARDRLRTAIKLLDNMDGAIANSPEHRARRAEAAEQLGLTLAEMHQSDQSRMLLEDAVEDHRLAVAANPGQPDLQNGLAESLVNLSAVLAKSDPKQPAGEDSDRFALATDSLAEAVSILESLISDDPGRATYRQNLSRARFNQAFVAQQIGHSEAANRHLLASAEILERLNRDHPLGDRDLQRLSQRWRTLAARYVSGQDSATAIEIYHKIIDVQTQRRSTNPQIDWTLSSTHIQLANQYRQVGEPNRAKAHYQAALEIHQSLASEHPDRVNYATAVWGSHVNLALAYLDLGQPELALKNLLQADRGLRDILSRQPDNAMAQQFLNNCQAAMVRARPANGTPETGTDK